MGRPLPGGTSPGFDADWTLDGHMHASVEAPRLMVVRGVDPSELIASLDVAEILGLAQASSVGTYLRRYDDFPRPVVELQRSHVRLWRRPEIENWARGHQAKRRST
jgi:predicted DNA-binding transcriptional regulator AlpA